MRREKIDSNLNRRLVTFLRIEMGISQREFSIRMNRPEEWTARLIAGKIRLTAKAALQIEAITNIPAIDWLIASAKDELDRLTIWKKRQSKTEANHSDQGPASAGPSESRC